MNKQIELRSALLKELQSRQNKNPRYSLRGFAKHLSVDYSLLSKFMRGQKPLGVKTALSVGSKVGLKSHKLARIHRDLRVKREKKQLDLKRGELLKSWYYLPILELMLTTRKVPNADKVATKLGVPAEACSKAIQELVDAGIWRDKSEFDLIVNFHKTETMRLMQKEFLKLAVNAMDLYDTKKRTTMSLTVAIDIDQLPLFTSEMRRFQRRLNKLAGSRKATNSIQHLQISFFPLLEIDSALSSDF